MNTKNLKERREKCSRSSPVNEGNNSFGLVRIPAGAGMV
jgi:hypothetical protein